MNNNRKLLNYVFYSMMAQLLWIFIGLAGFIYFYSILDISKIDNIYDTPRFYDFLWYNNVPETTLNTIISACVFSLIINIPSLVLNYKNYKNLKEEHFDRSTGYYEIIGGVLSLISTNIPSAILYVLAGLEIFKVRPKVKKRFKSKELEKLNRSYLRTIVNIISFTGLTVLALIIIIPFYWMIVTSLMSWSTFQSTTNVKFFLKFSEMFWINYKEAFSKATFGLYIKNTLVVAFWTTLGTVITTILSAFAFSRLEFKGRDFLFTLLLMTMMIPGELYVITNFVTISNTFRWYNTFNALIFPFVVDVFYIFFLRQTFKQIPDSLYKAAKVDGCSDFKFLTRVMIPIASPTLITITILNALGTWNAYIWPRLVTEKDHYLVSIILRQTFVDADTGIPDYRLQMAAASIITVPILIIFLIARKYIMRGVGRSGIKG